MNTTEELIARAAGFGKPGWTHSFADCFRMIADLASALRAATAPPTTGYVDIVFDGPPSHESGRFIEVENDKGASIHFGEWVHRDDGYWALRFAVTAPPSEGEIERAKSLIADTFNRLLPAMRQGGGLLSEHNSAVIELATAILRPPAAGDVMTDDQIKHMVDRFLNWRLPENFAPDGGIKFDPTINKGTPHEHTYRPVGTNLFDAEQADAMVRHMLEGLPDAG